jgi:excisionase family DNA binding protein
MARAKVKIQKTCKWCGKIFYGFNLSGMYCSHDCSTRARNARIRSKKAEEKQKLDTLETNELYTGTVTKQYLTVSDTAKLLGVSRPTIYSYLNQRILTPLLLGKRMYIRKAEVQEKVHAYVTQRISPKVLAGLENEVYTTEEMAAKFGISQDWIRKKARQLGITPIKFRRHNLWDRTEVDKKFRCHDEYPEITEWSKVEELMNMSGWMESTVRAVCSKRKVPRKHVGSGKFIYSTAHFRKVLGIAEPVRHSYYYVQEIMEKYGLTREQVYSYKKYYRISAIREGVRMKLSATEVDKVLSQVHQRD